MSSYQNKVNKKSTFRPTAPRLMDQVREVLRYHHYGKRTRKGAELFIHINSFLPSSQADKRLRYRCLHERTA